MSDVQVRLRHEFGSNKEAAVLGTVSLFDVDKVIPFINRWGVSCEGEIYDSMTFGQFVYDAETGAAYFEVVLADSDE